MQHMLVVVLCKNPEEQRPHNKLMIFVKVKEFPTSNMKKKNFVQLFPYKWQYLMAVQKTNM